MYPENTALTVGDLVRVNCKGCSKGCIFQGKTAKIVKVYGDRAADVRLEDTGNESYFAFTALERVYEVSPPLYVPTAEEKLKTAIAQASREAYAAEAEREKAAAKVRKAWGRVNQLREAQKTLQTI